MIWGACFQASSLPLEEFLQKVNNIDYDHPQWIVEFQKAYYQLLVRRKRMCNPMKWEYFESLSITTKYSQPMWYQKPCNKIHWNVFQYCGRNGKGLQQPCRTGNLILASLTHLTFRNKMLDWFHQLFPVHISCQSSISLIHFRMPPTTVEWNSFE